MPSGADGIGITRLYRRKNAVGTLFDKHWMSNIDFPSLTLSELGGSDMPDRCIAERARRETQRQEKNCRNFMG